MDRALDDVIGERQRGKQGGRNRGRYNRDRDGARKNGRDDLNRIDDDWLHDKYEDEDDLDTRPAARFPRNRRNRDRSSPEPDLITQTAKLRVENLHYDLTEADLEDLFTRIAPIADLVLTYDRAGRSTGTAYVTYRSVASARTAIREFDGANAHGQPIRLALIPSAPSNPTTRPAGGLRNPFDTAVKPGRSLFDRIEEPRGGRSRDRRDRSRSPGRRTNTRKPAPEGIDRYVPGEASRSRSPPRRRGDGGRRDGGRRGARGGSNRENSSGRQMVGGRPRITQEELDKDMDNYWGSKADTNGNTATDIQAPVPINTDGDIDMAE